MPNARQTKEIEKHMRNIKDAINDPSKGEKEVEKRTQKLYQYMFEEGLVPRNE